LIPRLIFCSTRRPYERLRTEKQPISSSWRRCDE
jgi:hypothetical protein